MYEYVTGGSYCLPQGRLIGCFLAFEILLHSGKKETREATDCMIRDLHVRIFRIHFDLHITLRFLINRGIHSTHLSTAVRLRYLASHIFTISSSICALV